MNSNFNFCFKLCPKYKLVLMEKEEFVFDDINSLEKFNIINQSGNITLLKTGSQVLGVQAIKKVQNGRKDEMQKIMKSIRINADKKSDNLTITADYEKKNNLSVTIQYRIEIPTNFKVFDIKNTGNIRLEKVAGTINIDSLAGNIDLIGLRMCGNNMIKQKAGNISLDADLKDASEVMIHNGTGNIILTIKRDSKIKIKAAVELGNIGGNLLKQGINLSGSVEEVLNEGDTLVELSTGIGNITILGK